MIKGSIQQEDITIIFNNTIGQMDLTDMYRTFYLTAAEYTFLLTAHETFSKIDYMQGHETSSNKFKTTEIISIIFFDYKEMKLEINKRKTEKFTNTWKLNNIFNHWVKEEILKIRRYRETKTQHAKTYGRWQKQC